jgi:hypothetical protein
MNEFVYGWYHYADGTDKEFRYPTEKLDDLKQDGEKVTIEIRTSGNCWEKRRGLVVWGGGNYTVVPTPAALLRAIPSDTRTQASRDNGKKGGRPKKIQE